MPGTGFGRSLPTGGASVAEGKYARPVAGSSAMVRALTAVGICSTTLGVGRSVQAQDTARVVMLGSGTPNADPERSGPSDATVVRGRAYLVDCGPGVVRRAEAAFRCHRNEDVLQAPNGAWSSVFRSQPFTIDANGLSLGTLGEVHSA